MNKFLTPLFLIIIISCGSANKDSPAINYIESASELYKKIEDIPVPEGYVRVEEDSGSFAEWLRAIPLKNSKTVYLYSGKPKQNQAAQFAVLDITVGTKDLQQCADVVMRLRAEYLYATKKYSKITFMDYNGKWYQWSGVGSRREFDKYLQNVFSWCGSASLEKQLNKVSDFNNIKSGDVLVQGGFPGHAMIVVDVAQNIIGKKIYMLVQGYQPAQDMHIVVNPLDDKLSPWYEVNDLEVIFTPEWKFNTSNLKTW